jgi:hypothetical protein
MELHGQEGRLTGAGSAPQDGIYAQEGREFTAHEGAAHV